MAGAATQIQNDDNAPDILMDLNRCAIPFQDESCAEIVSSHFLEHSNLDHIINESFRLLRPKGTFLFVVPYANSAEGMYPGHSIFLTEKWFQQNMNFNEKFKIVKIKYTPSEHWRQVPWCVRLVTPFDLA